MAHASSGRLDGVVSHENEFGLVLQGGSVLEVADTCMFTPNRDQAVLEGAELPIPNASEALPE